MNAAAAEQLEELLAERGALVYVWQVTKRRVPMAKAMARGLIAGAARVECYEDGLIAVQKGGDEVWLKRELEPGEAA